MNENKNENEIDSREYEKPLYKKEPLIIIKIEIKHPLIISENSSTNDTKIFSL